MENFFVDILIITLLTIISFEITKFLLFLIKIEPSKLQSVKKLRVDVESFEKQVNNINKKQLNEEENKVLHECRFILHYSLKLVVGYFKNRSFFNALSKSDDIKINLTLLNDYLDKNDTDLELVNLISKSFDILENIKTNFDVNIKSI